MDKYMKKGDVIAYIRNEAKEAQSAFEELGGESGIIAEAFEDLANELEDFPATDVVPVRHGRWQYNVGVAYGNVIENEKQIVFYFEKVGEKDA